MKLADLLAALGTEEVDRLAHEHVRTDDALVRPAMLNMIESVLRSYRFVQEFVSDRQPPTFAILTLLLDAPEYALPTAGFREAVMAETARICELVSTGEIVGRDDQLRLYRRVLYEARRNDLHLDASESAILGVLRRELGISQVEHFLVEHHSELQEFWNVEHCFLHEINALRSGGIVFVHGASTTVPEDLAPLLRQVVGIDMAREDARRLFGFITGEDLYDALSEVHAKTSGSKEERVERLLQHMFQPRALLRRIGLAELRELCRKSGAIVSGAKEELVERLIEQFASGRDREPSVPPPPPIIEARTLDEARFRLLFASLRGIELADILRTLPELRQSGSKDTKIDTLWNSHRSEETLLGTLINRELESILVRLDMRTSGSKGERIGRLIDHFRTVDPAAHGSADHAEEGQPATDVRSEVDGSAPD